MATLSDRLSSLDEDQRRALRERFRTERLDLTDFTALYAAENAAAELPSPAQERLWFMQQLAPKSPFYNLPAGYRIRGRLDLPALRGALEAVMRQQPELRSNLVDRSGTPHVAVHEDRGMPLLLKDLSGMPADERERLTEELMAREESEPFDLAKDPLIRGRLVRLAPEDHLLLVTIHHAVADGWSLLVFIRDLVTAYDAAQEPERGTLAPPTVRYCDFSAWQRRELAGPRLADRLAYWESALQDVPTLLELPTDRPRPAEQTFRGAVHRFRMPQDTLAAVRRLAGEENATLFMITLAAFQAVLGRYARVEDLVVGTPDAGRRHEELERVIGFFVNTLVLRADLSGDPTFRHLIRRARATALSAYENAEVPFDRLVDLVGARRDLSHSPLVQVMFQLVTGEERHWRTTGADPVEFELVDLPPTVTRFDIEFYLSECEDGEFEGWIVYGSDLFDEGTIARFAEHFLELLADGARRPDSRLSELRWLNDAELERVRAWGRGPRTGDATVPVTRLIADRVAEQPDAVAIEGGGRSCTYAELQRRADNLAHWLRESGVCPGDVVAVRLARQVDLAAAWLGVLRCGAAYLPLDPDYPRERQRYILADSRTAVILTDGADVSDLLPPGVLTRPLDEVPAVDTKGALPDPDPEAGAYVIYTSGSTGRPKGVLVPHRALQNFCAWHLRAHEIDRTDRASMLAALGFDAAAWELWAHLVAGASVHLVPDDIRLDPDALLAWFDRTEISSAFLPTALAESVLTAGEASGVQPRAMRVLFTGGDRLRRGKPAGAPYRFTNNYGPTENTIISVWTDVTADDRQPPIGIPVDNTWVYVLDGAGHDVPIGVPGELYLAGPQVAVGYLHRPELTGERFVRDPFDDDPKARMYATGDLVRWRPDGRIDFLGRIDDQVQIRGFRVEPGEIQAVLSEHDEVVDCVVLAHQEHDAVVLSAFVVGPQDESAGPRLRQHLLTTLPAYMVPSSFTFLPELPATDNGKLDREALLERSRSAAPAELAPAQRPRGDAEQAVAEIMAEVLGGLRLGRTDDFFSHGGSSLLATRVLARVGERLGVRPSLRTFFEAPTISGIAAAAGG
ncbi:amino acid adenylation domain-containing protein [Streptomyces sp. G44]|uniref:non-ribosomal peptide synthetase n=1 Tax=Streptomyces sp. G44 TaxID=2807632 RepID=UPI0019613993|nr:non-ribosomal peptide synthetase [Streptomyces sp. G44]MBM7168896.1 amino acid adenylation domain-containing protein [Streptomyces sp. G44]